MALLADGGFVGAAPLPSLPAAYGNRVSSTNTSYFAPTFLITVQPPGNKETDVKMVDSLRSELDTLLENKMADFAANEQRSGGMLNQKSRWG